MTVEESLTVEESFVPELPSVGTLVAYNHEGMWYPALVVTANGAKDVISIWAFLPGVTQWVPDAPRAGAPREELTFAGQHGGWR